MVARRHHYLPQCYLKGFSKPRKRGKSHEVHVFDRSGKTFRTNIINVAAERDFNRIEVEGHPPDIVEQEIAKFESKVGPALSRILESRTLKNEDDRFVLFNLIALVGTKNPRHRESLRQFHEQIAHLLMQAATSTEEHWKTEMRRMKADGYVPECEVPYGEMRKAARKKFRVEVPTERHIGYEMHALKVVLPTLLNRKWVVLLAPEESAGFVTCDYPVCLMFTDPKIRGGLYGPGHGLHGTELVFPIGRHMAIVGSFEAQEAALQVTESLVANVNGVIVAYADRQVYAGDPDFT
jgi:uncharacterized protein DUF4238